MKAMLSSMAMHGQEFSRAGSSYPVCVFLTGFWTGLGLDYRLDLGLVLHQILTMLTEYKLSATLAKEAAAVSQTANHLQLQLLLATFSVREVW